jgi:hypothetical protein
MILLPKWNNKGPEPRNYFDLLKCYINSFFFQLDEIIAKMEQQGPGAKKLLQVVHFDNCGHAPALLEDVQCNAIINFFFAA